MASPGQYLTFLLNAQLYGVPVASVREINRVIEVTPIPQTPPFVVGVINLRGRVIPVIGLRQKFGLPATENSKETCIIIIEASTGQVGVIVDAVRSVVDLSEKQIEATPSLGDAAIESVIMGLGKIDDKVMILVDVAKSVSDQNLKQVIEVGANAPLPKSA
jgi:purine-binding chemotaxis protein CheW